MVLRRLRECHGIPARAEQLGIQHFNLRQRKLVNHQMMCGMMQARTQLVFWEGGAFCNKLLGGRSGGMSPGKKWAS